MRNPPAPVAVLPAPGNHEGMSTVSPAGRQNDIQELMDGFEKAINDPSPAASGEDLDVAEELYGQAQACQHELERLDGLLAHQHGLLSDSEIESIGFRYAQQFEALQAACELGRKQLSEDYELADRDA